MTATEAPARATPSPPGPRVIIIGAGSRGRAYANAIRSATNGVVAAVAEPDDYKRMSFGREMIWGSQTPPPEGTCFTHWRDFISYETQRRRRIEVGEKNVPPGVDAAFVCVLDDMHREVVVALAALGKIHIMCEKPLATTLQDCLTMYRALQSNKVAGGQQAVFAVGHVLRYSPHNLLLHQLVVRDRAIGDVLSVAHTEPVGWFHFAHSYVRGNWYVIEPVSASPASESCERRPSLFGACLMVVRDRRKEKTSAPSLLTKCCHDIDLLLWFLCSPPDPAIDGSLPHLPSTVSSTGSLQHFKRSRKPPGAGSATNCLSCPIESECNFSAKRIYVGPDVVGLETMNTGWPVKIVVPDIESYNTMNEAKAALLTELAKDYDDRTPESEVSQRSWYGRCVYECDNDVCDEQVVTISWDEEEHPGKEGTPTVRNAKTAILHMVAQTKKVCERYTHLYGVDGEIFADSETITIEDFRTGKKTVHRPEGECRGHGGGDVGLTRQFILAVDKVKNHGWTTDKAQRELIGCTLEEVIRSHAMVFCAEEARHNKKVIDWKDWWFAELKAHGFEGLA